MCPNNRDGQGRQGMERGYRNGSGNANCMGNGSRGPRGKSPRGGWDFGNGDDRGMPLRRLSSPEGFLLWDTDEALPFMDSDNNESKTQVNLFPNPAGQSVQVSLSIDKDTSITIQVLDKDGKPRIESKNQKATAGIFTHTFDLSKMNRGIYFVKIKMGDQTLTERLIIQK
jgi:hypothetical protein